MARTLDSRRFLVAARKASFAPSLRPAFQSTSPYIGGLSSRNESGCSPHPGHQAAVSASMASSSLPAAAASPGPEAACHHDGSHERDSHSHDSFSDPGVNVEVRRYMILQLQKEFSSQRQVHAIIPIAVRPSVMRSNGLRPVTKRYFTTSRHCRLIQLHDVVVGEDDRRSNQLPGDCEQRSARQRD